MTDRRQQATPGDRGPIGAYRRAVRIRARQGTVETEMEDDVHHFRVRLQHADGVATAIDGEAVRTPWVVCPGALAPLRALTGQRLDAIHTLDAPHRSEHCLHIFDLALLAVAHAGDDDLERSYRIEGDYDRDPPQMTLWCDGQQRLSWAIDGGVIRGSTYDGLKVNELATKLADLPEVEREIAIVLRRASLISGVRRIDLDATPGSLSFATIANCYAKQPQRRSQALRVFGSTRDFWGRDEWPLETDDTRGR